MKRDNISPERLEELRRMTVGERLSITLKMIKDSQHQLFKGTPYQIARRFERIRKANDERNENMLRGIAMSERRCHEDEAANSDGSSAE